MSDEFESPSMAGNWQSYICHINGELASVFVDLALSAVAPLPSKPKLCWLWIRLVKPREDGLSSDEEFKSLCDFEDDLERTISPFKYCSYVGRITTKGRREFYFYADSDFDLQSRINNVLLRHPAYAWQFGEKTDVNWNHFINTLLPCVNGLNQIERRKAEK